MSSFSQGFAMGLFAPSPIRTFGMLTLANRTGYGFGYGYSNSHAISTCYADLDSPTGLSSVDPYLNYSLNHYNSIPLLTNNYGFGTGYGFGGFGFGFGIGINSYWC